MTHFKQFFSHLCQLKLYYSCWNFLLKTTNSKRGNRSSQVETRNELRNLIRNWIFFFEANFFGDFMHCVLYYVTSPPSKYTHSIPSPFIYNKLQTLCNGFQHCGKTYSLLCSAKVRHACVSGRNSEAEEACNAEHHDRSTFSLFSFRDIKLK